MLLVQDISFYRSKKKIFENINLSLTSNKIILLNGKNGSGKTTLIKVILNILQPNSGNIYWKGKLLKKNIYDFYNSISYIGDTTTSTRHLTVDENIKIWKKIFLSKINQSKIDKIITILNLHKVIFERVSSLSMGEIKKLEMIRLMIENKNVWVLDEPFAHLDDESLSILLQTFEDHCQTGGSIIFSSHRATALKNTEEILL